MSSNARSRNDSSRHTTRMNFKNVYCELTKTKTRNNDEISAWRESNEIQIEDPDYRFKPFLHFDEFGGTYAMIDYFKKYNYKIPTPIQSQFWPVALRGQDVIGIARTDQSSNLDFLIPALEHCHHQCYLTGGDKGPMAIILTSTKDQAQQIESEISEMSAALDLRAIAIYGRAPWNPQKEKLREKFQILIACPDRLLDFIDTGIISMKRVSFLAITDADRMDRRSEWRIREICRSMYRVVLD